MIHDVAVNEYASTTTTTTTTTKTTTTTTTAAAATTTATTTNNNKNYNKKMKKKILSNLHGLWSLEALSFLNDIELYGDKNLKQKDTM